MEEQLQPLESPSPRAMRDDRGPSPARTPTSPARTPGGLRLLQAIEAERLQGSGPRSPTFEEKQEHIDQLNRTIMDLKLHLQCVLKDNERLKEERGCTFEEGELLDDLAAKTDECEKYTAEAEEREEQILALKRQVESMEGEAWSDLMRDQLVQKVNQKNADLNGELKEASDKLASLQDDMEQLEAQCCDDVQEALGERDQARAELSTLLETDMRDLGKRVEELQAEADSARSAASIAHTKLQEEEVVNGHRVSALTQEVQQAETRRREAVAQLALEREDRVRWGVEKEELASSLLTQTRERVGLTDKMAGMEERMGSMKKELEEQQTRLESSRKLLRAETAELRQMEKARAAAVEEVEMVRAELETERQQSEEQGQAVVELTKQGEATQTEAQQLRETQEQLQEESSNLKSLCEALLSGIASDLLKLQTGLKALCSGEEEGEEEEEQEAESAAGQIGTETARARDSLLLLQQLEEQEGRGEGLEGCRRAAGLCCEALEGMQEARAELGGRFRTLQREKEMQEGRQPIVLNELSEALAAAEALSLDKKELQRQVDEAAATIADRDSDIARLSACVSDGKVREEAWDLTRADLEARLREAVAQQAQSKQTASAAMASAARASAAAKSSGQSGGGRKERPLGSALSEKESVLTELTNCLALIDHLTPTLGELTRGASDLVRHVPSLQHGEENGASVPCVPSEVKALDGKCVRLLHDNHVLTTRVSRLKDDLRGVYLRFKLIEAPERARANEACAECECNVHRPPAQPRLPRAASAPAAPKRESAGTGSSRRARTASSSSSISSSSSTASVNSTRHTQQQADAASASATLAYIYSSSAGLSRMSGQGHGKQGQVQVQPLPLPGVNLPPSSFSSLGPHAPSTTSGRPEESSSSRCPLPHARAHTRKPFTIRQAGPQEAPLPSMSDGPSKAHMARATRGLLSDISIEESLFVGHMEAFDASKGNKRR